MARMPIACDADHLGEIPRIHVLTAAGIWLWHRQAIGQARMADEQQIAKMIKEFAPGNVRTPLHLTYLPHSLAWPQPSITLVCPR